MSALKTSQRRQLLRGGGCLALGALFVYVFYFRYWKWRDCIADAQSSCVTMDGDNLIGGGQFWLIPAVLFIVVGLRQLLKYARS
jgi:hypothetical protein